MPPLRTFLAVETPPEVRSRAAALVEQLSAAGANVRWSDSDTWHWTLNFLGDVPDNEVPAVCKAAAATAVAFTPFDLGVCGCGAFPSVSRPRTIWLGAGVGQEPLVLLQAALTRHLEPLGFRPEARRFTPHLTLGRLRDGVTGLKELSDLLRQHTEFDAGTMPVDEVVVLASRLERHGADHTVLGRAPLVGRLS